MEMSLDCVYQEEKVCLIVRVAEWVLLDYKSWDSLADDEIVLFTVLEYESSKQLELLPLSYLA